MGLFGFVGRTVGKLVKTVARTGLSVATHGVSDKLFDGIAASKASRQATNNGLATLARSGIMEKRPTRKLKRIPDTFERIAEARFRRQAGMSATAGRKTGDKAPGFSGGLDLVAISKMWKAQDKPGSWIDFVKANSDVRKPAAGGEGQTSTPRKKRAK